MKRTRNTRDTLRTLMKVVGEAKEQAALLDSGTQYKLYDRIEVYLSDYDEDDDNLNVGALHWFLDHLQDSVKNALHEASS